MPENLALTLEPGAVFNTYVHNHGGRKRPISEPRAFAAGSIELTQLKETGRVFFNIGLGDLPNDVFEAKVTGVGIKLTGVTAGASTLNLKIRRSGLTEHKWDPALDAKPPSLNQWLSPGPGFNGLDTLTVSKQGADGQAAITFSGETLAKDSGERAVGLQCWGTGVAGGWEIALLEAQDLPRLQPLTEAEVTVFYSAFLAENQDAVFLDTVMHAGNALRPNTKVIAELALAAPPSGKPAVIGLNSSQPEAIKLPSGVSVPTGARSVQFPIEVGAAVAGKAVRLTASGLNQRVIDLYFPAAPASVKETITLAKPAGTSANISGLAVRGGRIFATQTVFPQGGHPKDQTGNGTLVMLSRTTGKLAEVARATVGHLPRSVDIAQAGNKLTACVLNSGPKGGPSLSTLLVQGDALAGAGAPIALPDGVVDVTAAPGGTTAYVSNAQGNVIHVVDLAAATQAPTAPLGNVRKGPLGLSLDAEGRTLYVACVFRSDPAAAPVNELIAIDLQTRRTLAVSVGPDPSQPLDVVVVRDSATGRDRLFVALAGGADIAPGVMVFEAKPGLGGLQAITKKPIRTLAGALAIAADQARGLVYAAAGDGVDIIDAKRLAVIARVDTGTSAASVAVDSVTGDVYVGDAIDGTVTRIAALGSHAPVRWS